MSKNKKVSEQEELFSSSCRFCESEAIAVREIASQDEGELSPVCQWHDDFFGWMYDVLGHLTRERLAIKDISEKEFHSKFG